MTVWAGDNSYLAAIIIHQVLEIVSRAQVEGVEKREWNPDEDIPAFWEKVKEKVSYNA